MKLGNYIIAAATFFLAALANSLGNQIEWLMRIEPGPELMGCGAAEDRNGRLVIGSSAGALRSIDRSGRLLWQIRTGPQVFGYSAISSKGVIYQCPENNTTFAVAPNGNERWRIKSSSTLEASAAVAPSGDVYVSLECLTALDSSGQVKWKQTPIRGGGPQLLELMESFIVDHKMELFTPCLLMGRRNGSAR